MEYAGADWIQRQVKHELSPLGVKVANILGAVFRGIYHLEGDKITKVDWKNDRFIEVRIGRDIATCDWPHFTELMVLCHDAAIRMDIAPHAFQHLKLTFHQRKRGKDLMECHPTMVEAIETARARIGFETWSEIYSPE